MTKYDLKVYEGNEEQETIRDLTQSQATSITDVFLRHHIRFLMNNIEERKGE